MVGKDRERGCTRLKLAALSARSASARAAAGCGSANPAIATASSASRRSRWMRGRAATSDPNPHCRSRHDAVSAADPPAPRTRSNRKLSDNSRAFGTTTNVRPRSSPTNRPAASLTCGKLAVLSQQYAGRTSRVYPGVSRPYFHFFAGRLPLLGTGLFPEVPPAARTTRFPGPIAMPACHRGALPGALDVSPSQGLWWRNGSIAPTVGVA